MGCMETVLKPLEEAPDFAIVNRKDGDEDVEMTDISQEVSQQESVKRPINKPSRELLYRCLTCKRLAHYAHLPHPDASSSDASLPEIAEYYQIDTSWLCADCTSFRYTLDKIIAWRPYPPNATEPKRPKDQPPPYKERLPREYLVKWQDRSFRRLSWVPHMWLVSTNASKLKNFLSGGTKVELLKEPVDDEGKEEGAEDTATFDIAAADEESRASSMKPGMAVAPKLPSDALPDAEKWIPPIWRTVDRVLDIVLWVPKRLKAKKTNRKRSGAITVISDDEEDEDEGLKEMKSRISKDGELPSMDDTETAEQWEERTGQKITMMEMNNVVWAFFKWGDLGYDEGMA
jgi:chromodomain-helicase-DNA-binding protein 4